MLHRLRYHRISRRRALPEGLWQSQRFCSAPLVPLILLYFFGVCVGDVFRNLSVIAGLVGALLLGYVMRLSPAAGRLRSCRFMAGVSLLLLWIKFRFELGCLLILLFRDGINTFANFSGFEYSQLIIVLLLLVQTMLFAMGQVMLWQTGPSGITVGINPARRSESRWRS
jgi:hypothetical protein